MDTSVVDTTLHYSGLHRQFYYNTCFYVYLIDLINVGNLLQLFKEKCKGLIHFLDRNVLKNCFFLKRKLFDILGTCSEFWLKLNISRKKSPST